MKTALTTFALFLSIHFIQAQTNVYQPYPQDNASWTMYTQLYNGTSYIQDWVTKNWSGEVVINGQTYTEVFDDPNIVGVRQDIPNEKIFYVDDQGVEHDASFDQSVQIGDTLLLTQAFLNLNMFPAGGSASVGIDTAYVDGVDSVLIGQTYRKRISMIGDVNTVGFYSADYICGVHFSSATTSISSTIDLECFYIDGQQSFGDPFNPYCTAGIEELPEVITRIYPNPSDGVFFIDYDEQATLLEIHLLDQTGKRIASFDKNKTEAGFDISRFPNGIYMVEVIFERGRSRTTLIK